MKKTERRILMKRLLCALTALLLATALVSCSLVYDVKEEVGEDTKVIDPKEEENKVLSPDENKDEPDENEDPEALPEFPFEETIELPAIPVTPSTSVTESETQKTPEPIERPSKDGLITPDENELPVMPME